MSTKLQIVQEAGRRLGDTSTEFLSELSASFGWVMKDLAAEGAIGEIVKKTSRAFLVAGQIEYDTRNAVTGADTGEYPTILELRVRSWGEAMEISRCESNFAFERQRAIPEVNGRPRLWQLWPNRRTLQLFPPPDTASTTAPVEILYSTPAAALVDADEVSEVEDIDEETLIFGMIARTAQLKDESLPDLQMAFGLYESGKARMLARAKGAMRIGQMARGNP